ncbi:Hypothetical predicted protein [Podarcis lilfordi]|nr:Hypothetical predicted protein [Podarcis lilfordi]
MQDQAVKAHEMFVEHLNKKHNSKYQKAPGEVTHIMVENTMGRIYHMNSVLVKAECGKDQAEGDAEICEIPLDAKKWECKGEVVQLYGIDTPYIHAEDCTEYQGPAVILKSSSATPSDEEEGTPYV